MTDVYLLALAVHHGGRFVTFDRSIPLQAVVRASRLKQPDEDSEHEDEAHGVEVPGR